MGFPGKWKLKIEFLGKFPGVTALVVDDGDIVFVNYSSFYIS